MKKQYKIYKPVLLFILLSFWVLSCNKSLNLLPKDQLSDAAFFKTPNDFKTFANQYYGYLKNFSTLQGVTDNPHSDGRADYASGGGSYGAGTNSIPATEPGLGNSGNWTTDYARIRATNYLLDKAADFAAPATIAQYVAEAKFFRAYAYFDLLQQYGGVPLILKLLDPNSAELFGARAGRDEVADQIVADLQAAIPDLPVSVAANSADYGRVTQMAAQAFLSRVTLYEGTWQKSRSGDATRYNGLFDKAIAASSAVIASNQFALFGTPASDALGGNSSILGDSAQKYLFILENPKSNPAAVTKAANHEYILAVRYDDVVKVSGVNISRSAHNGTGVDRKYANMFLCRDGLPIEKSPLFKGFQTYESEFQDRDNRMRYTLKIAGHKYWFGSLNARVNWTNDAADYATAETGVPGIGYGSQKWISERNVADRFESEDYPVIRYAEVLLNYAEAVYERNGQIGDGDLNKSLNLVRLRVNRGNGMPPLSNVLVGANGLDMRTEIRRERTIELFDEDFRLDDIKRWHSAASDLITNVGGSAYGNAPGFVSPWPVGIKFTGTQADIGPNPINPRPTNPLDLNGCLILDQTARQFSEKNYLYPIPAQQISLNPQLTQNPGW
ncbi:Starch-binding associating with outer membrane [Mucilaginibacter gossypiicola]|uniref:Starch-binding associating with outer membrane n=1 Tax=Mucilaginibacter gossypiicola TaxID=551995 RepID=A0A1H8LQ14_9SPHI|nr:RagB/SusD family nutrient uptake outer membrane protein [Mucilaginibacter gossypiicola]SEO07215.1 Starch-binding associating with outer membrane [Mucilaginibacter gossypiicola]